ncbi:MAG: glycosyl hydrolase family 39, partial [Terriglobales bacterium]
MKRDRAPLLLSLFALLLFAPPSGAQTSSTQPEILVIDAAAPAHPFPHFWEHMFGSGRANLTLRDSYRQDLRQV